MIAIVARVAQRLKRPSVDLLPFWEQEIDRAIGEDRDSQDARTFAVSALRFLRRSGVPLKIEDVIKEAETGNTVTIPGLDVRIER